MIDRTRTTSHLRTGAAVLALLSGLAAAAIPVAPAMAQTAPAGAVQGRVSDQQGGAFFAGAEVELVETGRRAVTGPDGRYVINGVAPGVYTLRTTYVGAPVVEERIEVSGAGGAVANIRIGADVTTVDNILVVGSRANLSTALNRKRNAPNLLDGVASDFIGQFPDQNVTEAAQRIPGVSINRDQGEGRFISIRGANPNLNAVTINGVGVPSAEGDQRQVALDVIPAELLSSLTVVKSLTPDMDADSIGGAVQIESATAFDRSGFGATVTAEGSYNTLRERVSPRIGVSASNIFDVGTGRLGIAGSFSYFDRQLGSDGVENGDGELDEEGGTVFPVTVEPRDYVLARTRLGAALNFDWRVSDAFSLYLRTLYSQFGDDEVQGGTLFEPDPDDGDNIVSGSAREFLLADQEVESYVSDREEIQRIYSLALGGENRFGSNLLEYQLAFSQAGEKNPDYVEFIFVADHSDTGTLVGTNLNDPRRPLIITNDLAGFNDASRYELDEAIFESGITRDREWSGRIDLTHDTFFGDHPGYVKTGLKVRLRDRMADLDVNVYGGADMDATAADFLNADIDYPLGLIAPQADPRAVAAFVRANQAAFDDDLEEEEDSFIDSNVEDYDVQEDVWAGYVMAGADIGRLTLTGGVRIEHTEYSARGNEITLDDDDGTLTLRPITVEDSYTDVLPSLNARYELNPRTLLRAAYFRSIVRPILEQNRPAGLIEIEDGEVEAEFGNVNLERTRADSFDLSIEYYPGDVGLLSAGVFYKRLRDPVYGIDLAGTPGYEGFEGYETFINGADADIFGIELGWQQGLTFLPAPFDGLLLAANYTWVDAEGAVPLPDGGERIAPLPFQAEHTANLSIGYQKHGFSARLAATYRDRILDEVGDPEDAAFDVYIDDHLQIDLTAAWQLTPRVQVFFEGSNLGDEPLYSFSGRRDVNVQYEEYGPSYTLGLKAVF